MTTHFVLQTAEEQTFLLCLVQQDVILVSSNGALFFVKLNKIISGLYKLSDITQAITSMKMKDIGIYHKFPLVNYETLSKTFYFFC